MAETPDGGGQRHKPLLGRALYPALEQAGLVSSDDNVARIVIDIPANGPVLVYIERYGDDRWFGILACTAGAQIVTRPPATSEPPRPDLLTELGGRPGT